MASQPYIIEQEQLIIDAKLAVRDSSAAFTEECRLNGKGQPYPENRDAWGTLHQNARQLHAELDLFLRVLGKEFD
jgi:hypothetical protein